MVELVLRNYEFNKKGITDRKEYKRIKSLYVTKLINKARGR